MNFLNDDKNLVVVAVLTLGLAVIFSNNLDQQQMTVISSVFAGLFGVAVGKAK